MPEPKHIQLPGVTYNKQRKRWIVRKYIDGKRCQLGSFKTLAEANAMVARIDNYSAFDSNTLYPSQSKNSHSQSLCQSDLEDDGDQTEKACIGRNEAPVPKKQWSNSEEFEQWLGEQPATFWLAENGDVAVLLSQQNRVVLVEYRSKRGTIHYEVSLLVGSEYNFNTSLVSASTSVFKSKREATKAFRKRVAR
jgi:hypothetical protein